MSKRVYLFIALAILLLTLEVRAQTDADVYAKINHLLPSAQAITIDGNTADWAAIPQLADPAEHPANPSLDATNISLAPLENSLLILAEFAGPVLSDGDIYAIHVDFAFNWFTDIILTLSPTTGTHLLSILGPDRSHLSTTSISGLPLAIIDNVLEMSIPYAQLTPMLPAEHAAALLPENHRSFVRVALITQSSPGVQLDVSAVLASYRLISTPYDLDPPFPAGLPNETSAPLEMSFPFGNQWFVVIGPDGSLTHDGLWAWDWVKIDKEFGFSNPPNSSSNNDYYSFGQPLYSPLTGAVTFESDIFPDNIPNGGDYTGFPNNQIIIDLPPPYYTLRLAHQKRNSHQVSQGDRVNAGDRLGDVGNSGWSYVPHLHLDVPGGGSHRVAHSNVRVNINHGSNDPWTRVLDSWEPRDGFFAAPYVPAVQIPLLPIGGIALLAIVMLYNVAAHRKVRSLGSE